MSAKEMFEEIGYEYMEDCNACLFRYVNKNENPYVYIYFYVYKTIELCADYDLSYRVYQAINKQVEELGWLGDKENE